MGKTIILIHGRSFKPDRDDLRRLWLDALEFGIQRDIPNKVSAFKNVKKEFIYYGGLSNTFLKSRGKSPDPNDLTDRKQTLRMLKQYKANQFTKARYKKLPGYNPWKEALASTFGALLGVVNLSDDLIESVACDMQEYWNQDSPFGSQVRATLTNPLKKAMNRGDDILVLSHSLGTMISYDTFWKFSYKGEYSAYHSKKVNFWITLGSPLGDETVKGELYGAQAEKRKYPANVNNWLNIAAEDDYIAHDERIAGDYKRMKKYGLIQSIKDEKIYNLAVRHGKSNPHSSAGYLIHPKTAAAVAQWL